MNTACKTQLDFWKGSDGYSIPGLKGATGKRGKSLHFSAYSINDFRNIENLISENKSLSNNENVIENEIYEIGDKILDINGNLSVIESLDPLELFNIGNIIYSNDSENDVIYRTPVDDSSLSVLHYKIDINSEQQDPGTITIIPAEYLYKDKEITNESDSPLHHHRHYGEKYNEAFPHIYIEPITNDVITAADGSTYTSKSFVESIINSGEYYMCSVILPSGLVIENPSEYMYVDTGYINMIDSSITGISVYNEYNNNASRCELLPKSETTAKYRNLFTGEDPVIKMYFEYSHNSKIYRMKINVVIYDTPRE